METYMWVMQALLVILAVLVLLLAWMPAAADNKALGRLYCVLGFHGPDWFGNEWGRCDEPFVRQCPHCGKRWYGRQVETANYRTLGDWKTEAELRASGEWEGA